MAEVNSPTLKVTLPSDREIVLTRIFDAPRRLVFEAMTNPRHVTRWFGPRGFTLPVCEIDLRPGGAYRYVSRGPDGEEMAMRGVYREIVPPERLVYTESQPQRLKLLNWISQINHRGPLHAALQHYPGPRIIKLQNTTGVLVYDNVEIIEGGFDGFGCLTRH